MKTPLEKIEAEQRTEAFDKEMFVVWLHDGNPYAGWLKGPYDDFKEAEQRAREYVLHSKYTRDVLSCAEFAMILPMGPASMAIRLDPEDNEATQTVSRGGKRKP